MEKKLDIYMKPELEKRIIEIAKQVVPDKLDKRHYRGYSNPSAVHWLEHLVEDIGNMGLLDGIDVPDIIGVIAESDELPPIAREAAQSVPNLYKAAVKRCGYSPSNQK